MAITAGLSNYSIYNGYDMGYAYIVMKSSKHIGYKYNKDTMLCLYIMYAQYAIGTPTKKSKQQYIVIGNPW